MKGTGFLDAARVQDVADSLAVEFSLPPSVRIPLNNQSDYYGALSTLRRHAGIKPGKWKFPWLWQHGWIPDFIMVDPLVITATNKGLERDRRWLVGNGQQEEFLREHGFEQVRCVGLPIVYADPGHRERISKSLLVMPGHSSEWTTVTGNCEKYAEEIAGLKGQFERIVVCLSESCFQAGNWIPEFWKHDISVVVGASARDQNSLLRMAALFKKFETVTSNAFGSHLAYAASFGAKVSLFGELDSPSPSSYRNEPLYKAFPNLLETYIPLLSAKNVKENLSFLVCNPAAADQHIAWGRNEIGWNNRLSSRDTQGLFEREESEISVINCPGQVLKNRVRSMVDRLPNEISTRIRSGLSKTFREEKENLARFERLQFLPRHIPGKIRFDNRDWSYADAPSFYYAYKAIFQEKCFALNLDIENPRIVDAGAHVGMASRFLKEKFPRAEIVAVEADGQLISRIRENLKGESEPTVRIIHAAVWKNGEGVEFAATGADVGHVVEEDLSEVRTVRAPSVTLEELVGGRRVDFLKIDIEGAEGEVLKAGKAALRWVGRIFVEYHSRVGERQDLAEVLTILSDAGFRVWMNSEYTPSRPLVSRSASNGMDLQLNITGMKEELL